MIKRKLLMMAFTLLSLTFLCSNLFAQKVSKQIDIANISNNGNNVSWQIKVPYESATLTVSAPNGKVFRKDFRAGETINFAPINSRGEYYGNGRFTYQIVLTPVLSPGTRDDLKEARENGESRKVADELKRRGELPQSLTKSGTFTFEKGVLVVGSKYDEEPANVVKSTQPKDGSKSRVNKSNAGDIPVSNAQVIANDLVVQGSGCFGQDCVNGESFGFDTIRLKENNLRIKFQDTSNSASFPTNDWQLTANDSSNGGANKFSIDDISGGKTPFTIEAGAPSNSLFVDDAGNLGLNTATPVVEIHVRDGDSPTLRLEQDGSNGFGSQTWDIAGNETNFFVRDVTNGSKLPFKILPSAATNSLVIKGDGNIGLGTTTPSSKLTLQTGDVEIKEDGKGIIFPDGTKQTTAVGGSAGDGSESEASIYAQQFYGGQGIRVTTSTITPVIDTNTFGIKTNGQAGGAAYLFNVPTSINLASETAQSVVYKIRYRDGDGTGFSSFVRVDVVANNISDGARNTAMIFDSNSTSSTGINTVTICKPTDSNFFNYDTGATHIFVTLVGSTTLNAEFYQVQVYKIDSPCGQ